MFVLLLSVCCQDYTFGLFYKFFTLLFTCSNLANSRLVVTKRVSTWNEHFKAVFLENKSWLNHQFCLPRHLLMLYNTVEPVQIWQTKSSCAIPIHAQVLSVLEIFWGKKCTRPISANLLPSVLNAKKPTCECIVLHPFLNMITAHRCLMCL